MEAQNYSDTLAATYDLGLAGNPLGFSPYIQSEFPVAAKEFGLNLSQYPRLKPLLVRDLAGFYGVSHDEVYLGKGAADVIIRLFDSSLMHRDDFLVMPEASFPVPAAEAQKRGISVITAPMGADNAIDFSALATAIATTNQTGKVGAVFLCNPNNPTGMAAPTADIIALGRQFPETTFIVSESNIEYVSEETLARIGGSLLDAKKNDSLPKNIIVVRSFSKAYGLANERIGYAIAAPEKIAALDNATLPFALSDRVVIEAMLALRDQEHIRKSREHMAREMPKLSAGLSAIGFTDISGSNSNLLIARVPDYFEDAEQLATLLRERDCAVVCCGDEFGTKLANQYIRLSPSTAEHNDVFLEILRTICEEQKAAFASLAPSDRAEAQPRLPPFAAFSSGGS